MTDDHAHAEDGRAPRHDAGADLDAPPDELEAIEPGDTEDDDEDTTGGQCRTFLIKRDPQQRLDSYLQQRLRGISRSRVARLIQHGGVTVNDGPAKPSHNVRRGDRISIVLPAPAVRIIHPEPMDLDILYEDDHFIVLNKQKDLVVHPARANLSGTLINGLAWHFKRQVEAAGHDWKTWETSGTGPGRGSSKSRSKGVDGLSSVGVEDLRPGIVHRLDKNTTGCIVVAKSDFAHWRLARQFEKRQVNKAYLAIVHGNFERVGDVIEQPIGKHPTMREAYAVRHDHYGRPSVTLLRVREQYRGYSLVELELKTGRTHQIRVHLSYLGHPIVGDLVYGGEPVGFAELDDPPMPAAHRTHMTFARHKEEGESMEAAARARDDMIMCTPSLHAAFLQFMHPATREKMTFTAPVHEPMLTLLRELRRRPAEAPVAREGVWTDLDQLVRG